MSIQGQGEDSAYESIPTTNLTAAASSPWKKSVR